MQIREPRIKPMHIRHLIFPKRIYDDKRIASSIDGVGKNGSPHAKELNWTVILHFKLKWTQYGSKTPRRKLI